MKKLKEDFKLDFIGVGAPKCATSWIYKCLLEHPQICGPYKKELNFFIKGLPHYNQGLDFLEKYFSHCHKNQKRGEFSPNYMYDPNTPRLIKEHFPDVKLIFCLRDPVKRAYSNYWFAKEFILKEKNLTFEEAIEKNPATYLDRGLYHKHLNNYLEIFPRENIGFFFTDDIEADPVKFIQGIYAFLGVDNSFSPPSVFARENAAKKTRSRLVKKITVNGIRTVSKSLKKLHCYFIIELLRKIGLEDFVTYVNRKVNIKDFKKPKMNPETEIKLKKIFKEDVEKIEKLTKKNLTAWK